MTPLEFAKESARYTIDLRQHFHENPELSQQEFKTAERICHELDKLNISYEKEVCGTGILATIEGQPGDVVLGLRADIDALPVTEASGVSFSSKNQGVMHACGHDGHIAMLLTAAKFLSENRDTFKGTAKLIFQPDEELEGAAQKIVAERSDFFEDMTAIAGLHVWPDIPVGTISVDSGPRMAEADFFDITIVGSSGHGSMPHQTIDPVLISAHVITSLQSICSRQVDPFLPTVVSVCAVNGGVAHNAIPDTVHLKGTCRYFSNDTRDTIKQRIETIVQGVTSSFGATYEIEYLYGAPFVENDEHFSSLAQQSVINTLGASALVSVAPSMAGEDFSEYLQKVPGCFGFIGIGKGEGQYPLHHSKFDMQEAGLINGVAFLVDYASSLLK
ncbi:amidohydrolase [Halomonas sp. DP5Y7-2]|uniref:M20 metallopeptidase family protein n=1 Tax=Halomonas sp. DP5Y7-2 TaxID=2859076 RepID=UPI001C9A0BF7|nr:amidohydrolase [Halomonas sp. DP5Y7-2]MBY5982827.1 amidohydrolase [Halomonas sp. DP5Y7-2]